MKVQGMPSRVMLLWLCAVAQVSAINMRVGPTVNLLHRASDRYIDGLGVSAAIRSYGHVELIAAANFYNWTTGVDRNSPGRSDEFIHKELLFLAGLRYCFSPVSSCFTPYLHVIGLKTNDRIEHRVTLYEPPEYGLVQRSANKSNEDYGSIGLGLGFYLPIFHHLAFDMNFSAYSHSLFKNNQAILTLGLIVK
ncbi:MAG TPA: hypothetical protein PKI62_07965 [bacterium]|nr:hypothetical protein [bacterium]HPR88222.1 hypothetical protein [bacterium]